MFHLSQIYLSLSSILSRSVIREEFEVKNFGKGGHLSGDRKRPFIENFLSKEIPLLSKTEIHQRRNMRCVASFTSTSRQAKR